MDNLRRRWLTSAALCFCAVYAPSPVNYPVPEVEQVPDRNPGDLQVVDEYALEHEGSNPGFQAMTIILPKSKRGIVVFTNGDNGRFIYNNIIEESIDLGKDFLDIMNNPYSAPIIKLSQ